MQLLKILSIVLLVVLFAACENTDTNTTNQETAMSSTEEGEGCPVDTLPKSTAIEYLSEARVYIEGVNSTIPEGEPIIPRGAETTVCELQEIVNDLGEDGKVWAMLGMKDGQLEIVFQGITADNQYKYYDFTRPCPNACPPPDENGE
ncbi:MAG: hypothetical protein AB8G11_21575 [Saprospiraceae bacterium]